MKQKDIATFKRVKEAYRNFYSTLLDIKDELKETGDIEELADRAYFLREISKLFEELRKESNTLYLMASRIACAIWVTMPDADEKIKTEFCTATPRVRNVPKMPSMRTMPVEYTQMMLELGVPREMIESDVLRPYWPGLLDHCTGLERKGKAMPGGIDPDKTKPEYSLLVRKTKGIDE